MKIKDILCEVEESDIVNNIVRLITSHCKPFLGQIDSQVLEYPLYRGFFTDTNNVEPISLIPGYRADRKPVDTPEAVHKAINAAFVKQFNYPFRNGTFASSVLKDARAYGNVSLIMPIGEFHYLWSPDSKDLYQKYRRFVYDYLENAGDRPGHNNNVIADFIHAINTNQFQYKNNDLKAGIKSGHEVMIYCDKCYKLPYNNPNVKRAVEIISQGQY